MKMRDTKIVHALLGNDTAPTVTGLTRGLVAAGMGGAVQAVLIFVPIPDAQKVELMTALGPGVILLSYVLFGFLDQHTKGGKN